MRHGDIGIFINTWTWGQETVGYFPTYSIWLGVHGAGRQWDISQSLAGGILDLEAIEYFPQPITWDTVGYFPTYGWVYMGPGGSGIFLDSWLEVPWTWKQWNISQHLAEGTMCKETVGFFQTLG